MSPVVQLIVLIIVVGVCLALANKYLPMEQRFKEIMNTVAIVAVVLVSVIVLIPLLVAALNTIAGAIHI